MNATLTIVFSTVFGLLIGSFLNVVIARVPGGRSVVHPPSACPTCNTTLAARDNIPVVSWLILGRRCRTCRTPISAQYPAVEAATALLFALMARRIGPDVELGAMLIATAAFVALSVIDLQTRRLPDKVVFPSLALTAAALVLAAVIDDRYDDLGRAGIGMVIGFGALLIIHLVRPDGMGFGDVKLAALCGVMLGWFGLAEVVIGLYGGFVLGAVVGVAVMAGGRGGRRTALPFGPFLAAGTLITVLLLDPVADAVRDVFA